MKKGRGCFFRSALRAWATCAAILAGALPGLILAPVPIPAHGADSGKESILQFAVFADSPAREPSPAFRLEQSPAGIEIVSSVRLNPARPLLLVLDPAFGRKSEVRQVVLSVTAALAQTAGRVHGGIRVRAAIPVVGGLLTESYTSDSGNGKAIAEAAASIMPDGGDATAPSFARTMDLVLELLAKVQSDWGSLDCLIIARDQVLDEEAGEYLSRGFQRRALEICARNGSTLHLLSRGVGLLREVALASGGEVFSDAEAGEGVVRRILDARSRADILSIRFKGPPVVLGRAPLRIVRGGGPGALRAPQAIWLSPEGGEAPDLFRTREAIDWMRRARAAQADGNLTQALQFAEQAVKEDPGDAEPLILAGRFALELGDVGRADRFLSSAVRFADPADDTLILYARSCKRTNRAASALELLDRRLAGGRALSPAMALEYGRLLAAVGRSAEARRHYEAVLADAPDSSGCRAEYGHLLVELGEIEVACDQFRRILEREADQPMALAGMSRVELARGRPAEAVKWAARGLESQPRNPEILLQAGRTYLVAGDGAKAVSLLQEAWRLGDGRRDILFSLVDSLVETGRAEPAFSLLKNELSTEPESLLLIRKVGEVHQRVGSFAEAAATLEAAASFHGGASPELFGAAAELRERMGEYGQALLNYRARLQDASASEPVPVPVDLRTHLAALSLRVGGSTSPIPPTLARDLALDQRLPPGKPAPESEGGLEIPGGLDLLARTLGVERATLDSPNALEMIFHFLQETSGPTARLQEHSIRYDLVIGTSHYNAFLDYLKKNGLLPAPPPGGGPVELLMPILGDDRQAAAVRKVLSFFGVEYRRRNSGSAGNPPAVELGLRQSRQARERQKLLQNLGVNLLDKKLREIRIRLRTDELPLLGGPRDWSAIVSRAGRGKGEPLLARFAREHRAMRLYIALARCTKEARSALLRSLAPQALLEHAGLLQVFGPHLDFRDGRLQLPGSARAWEELAGAWTPAGGDLFVRLLQTDRGRGLFLYRALAGAPRPVQDYLTAVPQRLRDVYQVLAPFDQIRSEGIGMERQDLGRLFRALQADGEGLYLPVDARFGKYLLPHSPRDAASSPLRTRIVASDLSRLLTGPSDPGRSGMGAFTPSIPDLLRLLQAIHPQSLSEQSIALIMKDPAHSSIALDLVWDLELGPEELSRYLAYSHDLAGAGEKGWNIDRTRISQAVFVLLSAFRREGILSQAEGTRMLNAALDAFSAPGEQEFAFRTARFLSKTLLPALSAATGLQSSSPDLILRALAGNRESRDFYFQGRRLRFEGAVIRLGRMKESVSQQRFRALPDLLQGMEFLQQPPGPEGTGRVLTEIRKLTLPGEASTLRASGSSRPGRRPAAAGPDVARSGKDGGQAGGGASAAELVAALHTEIGTTLLAYCYAYHSSPETDALAFDPEFVRKHRFYIPKGPSAGRWTPARLEQAGEAGTFVAGSLSGLGLQLVRMETAQANEVFASQGTGLGATLLASMRAIPPPARSDRAQEFIALSVRLGEEVLALASADPQMNAWCARALESLVPPSRREPVLEAVRRGDPSVAARILSPSELLLLGSASLEGDGRQPEAGGVLTAGSQPHGPAIAESENPHAAAGSPPLLAGPPLARLRKLAKLQGAEADSLRAQVEEYGVFLFRRAGINRNSFLFAEPYEFLDSGAGEDLVYERLCDLKIRMAELQYSLGIPAFLGEALAAFAVRDVLPGSTVFRSQSWRTALEMVHGLGVENARAWMEELMNRGWVKQIENGETE